MNPEPMNTGQAEEGTAGVFSSASVRMDSGSRPADDPGMTAMPACVGAQ
jgi:hypothetical protein